MPFAVSLLIAALAVLGAGCATAPLACRVALVAQFPFGVNGSEILLTADKR
jgi:hypothetical protein